MPLKELMDLFKQLNWVDIFVLAMAVRIIYTSVQAGFVVEFLKFFGGLVALFFTFHYYAHFAGLIHHPTVSPGVIAAAVFGLIWITVLLLGKLVAMGFLSLFSVQPQNAVDKWGAVVLGIGRIFITTSMVLFLFFVTEQKYMQSITLSSVTGRHLLLVSPKIYGAACDGFITRLLPDEKKNPAVAQVLKDVVRK